jgi:hypothetical protein
MNITSRLKAEGYSKEVYGSEPSIAIWVGVEDSPSKQQGYYVDLGGNYFAFGAWTETYELAHELAEKWYPTFRRYSDVKELDLNDVLKFFGSYLFNEEVVLCSGPFGPEPSIAIFPQGEEGEGYLVDLGGGGHFAFGALTKTYELASELGEKWLPSLQRYWIAKNLISKV